MGGRVLVGRYLLQLLHKFRSEVEMKLAVGSWQGMGS